MGATANKRLNVAIVGRITAVSATVLLMAPIPTAIPPMHPTTVMMTQISPNRLNSTSEN